MITICGQNINLIQGDTGNISMGYSLNGQPRPFQDGDTVKFIVTPKNYSEPILLEKAVTSFTEGRAVIEFNISDTQDIEPTTYEYRVILRPSDSQKDTIIGTPDFKPEFKVGRQ